MSDELISIDEFVNDINNYFNTDLEQDSAIYDIGVELDEFFDYLEEKYKIDRDNIEYNINEMNTLLDVYNHVVL